ncbi:hypothetical protein [Micromonospora sp. NPDC049662]|uniref:hypothetical protein n=1 Tax=Micromonospora sp. NPDC049662 TaxID=3155397 RepID=UPI003421B922
MPFEELNLAAFAVCLTCGHLRDGAPHEQRCRCQPRTPEWEQQWQGQDIAGDLDLCVLCVRNTAAGPRRRS